MKAFLYKAEFITVAEILLSSHPPYGSLLQGHCSQLYESIAEKGWCNQWCFHSLGKVLTKASTWYCHTKQDIQSSEAGKRHTHLEISGVWKEKRKKKKKKRGKFHLSGIRESFNIKHEHQKQKSDFSILQLLCKDVLLLKVRSMTWLLWVSYFPFLWLLDIHRNVQIAPNWRSHPQQRGKSNYQPDDNPKVSGVIFPSYFAW